MNTKHNEVSISYNFMAFFFSLPLRVNKQQNYSIGLFIFIFPAACDSALHMYASRGAFMDGVCVCVAHIKMGHSSARQIHCEHTDIEWSSVDKAIVCLQRSLSLSPIHAVTPQPFYALLSVTQWTASDVHNHNVSLSLSSTNYFTILWGFGSKTTRRGERQKIEANTMPSMAQMRWLRWKWRKKKNREHTTHPPDGNNVQTTTAATATAATAAAAMPCIKYISHTCVSHVFNHLADIALISTLQLLLHAPHTQHFKGGSKVNCMECFASSWL